MSLWKNANAEGLFATLLWINWSKRNKLIFKNQSTPHELCFTEAVKLNAESLPSTAKCHTDVIAEAPIAWRKPPAHYVKVNVDAAVDQKGKVGVGIIIRNDGGNTMWCRCKSICANFSPEVAEAIACEEGLAFAREMGCSRVVLETDCQEIRNKLCSARLDISPLGEIIRSIQLEVLFFDDIIFSWARRDANTLAHLLAQLAVNNSSYFDFSDDVPEFIYSCIPNDERFISI